MHFSVKKLIWTAAAAFILVAAVVILSQSRVPSLLLLDRETGKEYARFPFGENDSFSITFIHSVNQSPVTDYYKREKDDTLLLYSTKFHAFGAGMPESWPEGAHVETSPDGILVTNLHITLPDVTYIVGTVSDHTLRIGGKTVSLRDLCGKNAEVLFKLT